MTKKEFLEKYGSEKVYFESICRFVDVKYSNEELGIYCSGIIGSPATLFNVQTIESLFGLLEKFSFGFINKKD